MDVFRKIQTWDGTIRAPTFTSGKGAPSSDEPEGSIYIDTTPHRRALFAHERNTAGALEWKPPDSKSPDAR